MCSLLQPSGPSAAPLHSAVLVMRLVCTPGRESGRNTQDVKASAVSHDTKRRDRSDKYLGNVFAANRQSYGGGVVPTFCFPNPQACTESKNPVNQAESKAISRQ